MDLEVLLIVAGVDLGRGYARKKGFAPGGIRRVNLRGWQWTDDTTREAKLSDALETIGGGYPGKTRGPTWTLAKDFDPGRHDNQLRKDRGARALADSKAALLDLQDRFFARADQSLLIHPLQAIDAAGKDGTIKHVMSGLNPEGVDVYSFKTPSANGAGT